MTDQQLLELAARAAGYEPGNYEDGKWFEVRYGMRAALWLKDAEVYWNPLGDDGDALRLAVKLRLDIMPGDVDQEVSTRDYAAMATEPNGDDPYAACRRAIVRSAAEIARALAQ
jgi:hypothetical protein